MRVELISPWLAHRERNTMPRLLVIHATAGASCRSSIDYLRKIGLSYHYIITRDGRDSTHSTKADTSDAIVFQCVPEAMHAFHVGSTIPSPCGAGGINKCSIGISLANTQSSKTPDDYTSQQRIALDELIQDIIGRRELRWITGHVDCQPWNRADPRQIVIRDLAELHGLEYWQPDKELIRAHTPKRTRLAA